MTVGILPGSDRSAANRLVTVVVARGLDELRNGLVVRAADAVIAIAGEYSTAPSRRSRWRLKRRQVVALGTWEIPGVVDAADPVAAIAPAPG